MLPQIDRIRKMALDLLFPRRCVNCGREGEFICRPCQILLPRLLPPLCPRCGRPQLNGIICPDCINWNSDIDAIRSPFRFEGTIRQAVYQLKYKNLRAIAPLLSGWLSSYLAEFSLPGDVIVPVPLFKDRMKERGYNQSALLARGLGKAAGISVDEHALVRERATSAQARTSGVDERKRNVTGAFRCRDNSLAGRKIIVLDDVSTSGATLDACASALKEAGAVSVWGLTLAREI